MRHLVQGFALSAALFLQTVQARETGVISSQPTNSAVLFSELVTLNPHARTNLSALAEMARTFADESKRESKQAEQKIARSSDELKNLSFAELRKIFTDDSAKHEARAASIIAGLADSASQTEDLNARNLSVTNILEIQAALRNSRRSPVPEKLGMITTWIFFFQNSSGSIGKGTKPAANVASTDEGGRTDPTASTFWQRPSAIAHENLYAGFGREQLPQFDKTIFHYSAPKTSSGTHAGFDVEAGGQRLKIKFGEVSSEPFTARIFYALGYHVDPTDYAPELKIRYDRRLFREFHLRKPLQIGIAPFGIATGSIRLQPHYDPFAFIKNAVFKDGHQISGTQLKQMLFFDPKRPYPEDSPENFRPEIENQMDYLVTVAANVQPRDGPTHTLGSWDFGELGHENLRELRGAGLLAAWLAWFDSRPDNTKLRIRREDAMHLEHFISDLGGGMGGATGWFSPHGEDPNKFQWTFTAPEIVRGRGQMTTPFRIKHFKPVVPTAAFGEMTADDARWMARLIGQLTEKQLCAALIASGYDNAETKLYLEKLISRRDQMIRDLRLEKEIPLLRPTGQNREFSYKAKANGPCIAALQSGETVRARTSNQFVRNGRLVDDTKNRTEPAQ